MNKVLKVLFYVTLISAILSNSYVHVEEIIARKDNEGTLIGLKAYQDLATQLTILILNNHKIYLDYLYDKVREPDFEKMLNGIVVVYNKNGGYGAGVCMREDEKYYYILSASHVTKERPENNVISVRLRNNIIYPGEVIKDNFSYDLSLIRIIKFEDLIEVLPLASANIQVGDKVFIVGHPLGLYFILTEGIMGSTELPLFDWINATTTYGNSGGGIFNKYGELVGISSRGILYIEGVPESGLGAIIKLDIIKEFLKDI